MLHDSPAFSSFSVNDLQTAKQFYGDVLGLDVSDDEMGITITTGNKHDIFVYQKDDHVPATFTILNFSVADIEKAVSALKEKGVAFEHYPDMTDEDGIARSGANNPGPDIAWFKDPAGNFLSIMGDTPTDQSQVFNS